MNLKNSFLVGAILLSGVAHSMAAESWAYGVSLDGGWHDADKIGGDEGLCWAASAGNLAAWWECNSSPSTYPGQIPALTDKDSDRTTAIFNSFKTYWNNSGLNIKEGLMWYFGGNPLSGNTYNNAFQVEKPESTGRYWEDYVKKIGYSSNESSTTYASSLYTNFTYATDTMSSAEAYAFASNVVNVFEDVNTPGGVGLLLSQYGKIGSHAVTLWGIEYEGDVISKIYITDSDDNYANSIVGYDVTYKVDNEEVDKDTGEVLKETRIYIDNYLGNATVHGYDDYHIVGYTDLRLPFSVIPEPATAVLTLFGSLPFMLRRRRK